MKVFESISLLSEPAGLIKYIHKQVSLLKGGYLYQGYVIVV